MSSRVGTFVFTDIVESTRLWETEPEAMSEALNKHDETTRRLVTEAGGEVFKHTGDGVLAFFQSSVLAADGAIDLHRALGEVVWPTSSPLLVRIGLHDGLAEERDHDLFGSSVSVAARVNGLGHGGQTIATRAVVEGGELESLDRMRVDELGTFRLKGISEPVDLFQLSGSDDDARFPALRTDEKRPGNLPTVGQALVGRHAEVDRLLLLVEPATGPVTIVGPGGVGKTRLATHVSHVARIDDTHGRWFIDLAQLNRAEDVAELAASVLGIDRRAGTSVLETIAAVVADLRMLVVIDNAEHLLEAAADLADALSAGPGVRVIVTSRAPLSSPSEQQFRLQPLSIPRSHESGGDAVDFFESCARRVNPEFVAGDHGTDVANLVRKLDGMPLALEIAASRIGVVSPAEMISLLDSHAGVLDGELPGDHPMPRGGLSAALELSYENLSQEGKHALEALSVFRAGFSLEASCSVAEVDTTAGLAIMAELTACSVVMRVDDGFPGFRLLDTTRAFAAERLERRHRTSHVQSLHASHFARWICEAAERFWTPDAVAAIAEADSRYPDLKAAARWATENNAALAGQIVVDLRDYWAFRNLHDEGLRLLQGVLDTVRASVEPAALISILEVTAVMHHYRGEHSLSEHHSRDAIDIAEASGLPMPLLAASRLAVATAFLGRPDEALEIALPAAELAQQVGGRAMLDSLPSLSVVVGTYGDPDQAQNAIDECMSIAATVGPVHYLSLLINSGIADLEFDPEGTLAVFEEAVETARHFEDRGSLALARHCQGTCLVLLGRLDEAGPLLAESAQIHARTGEPAIMAQSLELMVSALVDHDPQSAAELMGAADTLSGEDGMRLKLMERLHTASLEALVASLGERTVRRLRRRGSLMNIDRAAARAAEVREKVWPASP